MKTLKIQYSNIAVFVFGLVCLLFLFTSFKNFELNKQKPTTHVVTINQMKFDPENIKVKKGDIVEWVNKDIVPHDVTEINKKWTSKPLKPGDKFSKVITQNFQYFCSIHVVMKGSVTIIK